MALVCCDPQIVLHTNVGGEVNQNQSSPFKGSEYMPINHRRFLELLEQGPRCHWLTLAYILAHLIRPCCLELDVLQYPLAVIQDVLEGISSPLPVLSSPDLPSLVFLSHFIPGISYSLESRPNHHSLPRCLTSKRRLLRPRLVSTSRATRRLNTTSPSSMASSIRRTSIWPTATNGGAVVWPSWT